MIQKILFPVDFSSSSIAMAAYVKRAAAMFRAEVTIIHVCDLSSHDGFELYTRPAGEIAEEHVDLARHKLEGFLSSEFPAVKTPRLLLAGDAAKGILETAKNRKFDLIIMPTHAGRFRRLLLGSTTARVVHDADCPVLTTEHSETIAPRSLEHRNWICGVGLSPDSARVFRYAETAARAAGANLSLIHVIDDAEAQGKVHGTSDEEQKARQRLAELQGRVPSDASARIAFGPVKETLLDHARQASADVLVIGRSLRGGLELHEDLTYSLVRDSPCPVISV
jgi:nucleotide-binding universal stress UspA family protein